MSKSKINFKIVYLTAGFIVLLLIIIMITRYSTPEDAWLCQNGQWVKHGHPAAPQPIGGCGANVNNKATNSANTATSTAKKVYVGLTVNQPLPSAIVISPLTIKGSAKGNWYFEAQFPVKLTDANNKVLAQGAAKAQGDWMTENYVPFELSLTFKKPTTATGFLVFAKDNPSGLPANAQEYKYQVKFK